MVEALRRDLVDSTTDFAWLLTKLCSTVSPTPAASVPSSYGTTGRYPLILARAVILNPAVLLDAGPPRLEVRDKARPGWHGPGHKSRCSSSMPVPTSERIPRSVPLATSRPGCTGTVVPRPSGCRMTWWLPLTRATLKPALSNARTIRSPGKDGTGGIRPRQP